MNISLLLFCRSNVGGEGKCQRKSRMPRFWQNERRRLPEQGLSVQACISFLKEGNIWRKLGNPLHRLPPAALPYLCFLPKPLIHKIPGWRCLEPELPFHTP
jgi:hypothetical protein